jgi:hypothetical protein
MDKKLEARVARLERSLKYKNENLDEMSSDDAMQAFNDESSNLISSATVAVEKLNDVKLALFALNKAAEWLEINVWHHPPEVMKEMSKLVSQIDELNARIQLSAEKLGLY